MRPRSLAHLCQARAGDGELQEEDLDTALETEETESWREEAQKAAEKSWPKEAEKDTEEKDTEEGVRQQALVSPKHRRRGHTDPVPKQERAEVDPLGAHHPGTVGPWGQTLSESVNAITNEEFCDDKSKPVIVTKAKYRPHLPGVLKKKHDEVYQNWDFGTCSLYSLELCYATCGMTLQSCRDEYEQCMTAACA